LASETIFNLIQTGFTVLTNEEKAHVFRELTHRFPHKITNSVGFQLLLRTYSTRRVFFIVAKLTYLQFMYGVKCRMYPINVKTRLQNWMEKMPRTVNLQWTVKQRELAVQLSTLVGSDGIRWGGLSDLDLDESLLRIACEEHEKSHLFVFEQYKQMLKRVVKQRMLVSDHTYPLFSQQTSLLSIQESDDRFGFLMYTFAEGAKEILEEEASFA